MKKRLDLKYFVVAIFITSIFFLGMMSFFLKEEKNFTFVDKLFKDSVHYLGYTVQLPFRKIHAFYDRIREYQDLYEKYEALQEEVEKTDFMTSKYNESLKVIEELESMLDLNATLMESEYLNATIISRNLGYWYDKVTIDKGSRSGVEIGSAVITSDGLIGRVISTSYTTSDVKLLTSNDINQKISVKMKTENNYVYGILTSYDEEKRVFTVEGISGNIEIPTSAEVTTTGLGDAFPSGILIGTVSKITKDHFDLARTVEVTSKVDFNGISYVTILKRKNK